MELKYILHTPGDLNEEHLNTPEDNKRIAERNFHRKVIALCKPIEQDLFWRVNNPGKTNLCFNLMCDDDLAINPD